jgi:ABC-type glycerol-3-phosphate transport system permease component
MARQPTEEFLANRSWLFDSRGGAILRRTAVGALVVMLAVFVLFPLYWMVVTAFKTTAEIQQIPVTLYPNEFSVQGFEAVIESSIVAGGYAGFVERTFGVEVTSSIDIDVLLLVVNSLKVSIGAAVIAVVFGSIAAYVLSRREFLGKDLMLSLLLASLMFPGTAIMVPEWELINTLDLFNTHTALVLIYGAMTAPFVVWLMKGFFDEFPSSILDAARMDQCSPYEIFRYVLMPMSINSLIASFIFAFLLA